VDHFAKTFFIDPSAFYLIGRIFIGVIPGMLSIFFTYRLSKRLFSSTAAALYSASLIAFGFINVVDSRYIYTDMLLLLFAIISINQVLKIKAEPILKNYLFAAFLIGTSIAIKYNAAILIIPLFTTHLQLWGEKKSSLLNKNVVLFIIMLCFTFFLFNPYAFLDHNSFLASIIKQKSAETYIGWSHHIIYSLKENYDLILLAISIAGLFILTIRLKDRGLIFSSFPLVFYLHLVFLSQQFPRYIIPLTPFLAIGAGYILYELIYPKIRKKPLKLIFVAFSLLLLLPMICKDIKMSALLMTKDTRIEAKEWIQLNLDKNAKIAVDSSFFRPAITQNARQITDKIKSLNKDSIEYKKLMILLSAQPSELGNYIYFLSNNNPENGFLSSKPKLAFNLKELKEKGIEYVAINFIDQNKENSDFYFQLKKEAELVASFSPYIDNSIRMSHDQIANTCAPVSSQEIYSRKKPGPAIQIYRLI